MWQCGSASCTGYCCRKAKSRVNGQIAIGSIQLSCRFSKSGCEYLEVNTLHGNAPCIGYSRRKASVAGCFPFPKPFTGEDCISVSHPVLSGDESTPEPENRCSSDSEFPDLSPKALSDFELGQLKFTLKKASQEIVVKFASLEHNTISMLRETKVPLGDVKNYVLSLGTVYTESAYKGKPLLLQQEDKFELADDFGSLFLTVKLYYSWFNFHIIEALRKEFLFHEKTEVDEQLNKYKSDLHDYCRRRCFECPKDMFSNSSAEGFVSLCFKINDEFEMYNLNHVKQFQYSLSDILGLPNYTFQLCDVTDGCVTVIFRIPSCLADVITISSEQQQKLVVIGVKQLRVTTRILFEEEVCTILRVKSFACMYT